MERRAYGRRTPVEATATVQSGSRRFPARVIDLGIGGMALETEPEVELVRFLRIHARLLADQPPLDVDAIVRRRENRSRAVRWGVEFVEPSAAALALVEVCLDEHAAPEQEQQATEAIAAAARPGADDGELAGLFQSALRSLDL